MIKYAFLLTLVGLGPSFAAPNVPFPEGNVVQISRRQAHENALRHHPAERSILSHEIEEYWSKNKDKEDHTIYLKDEQAFVSMSSITNNSDTLQTRESGGCIAGLTYVKSYAKQTGQWYDAWQPASSCLYTQKSDARASEQLSTSTSMSISNNIGVDIKIIPDILSASLGITVTASWSDTRTHTCYVKPGSVVQVFAQQYIAWGWIWSQKCEVNKQCGGCQPEYVNGGVTAPAISPNTKEHANYGCSTGTKNVKC